MNTTLKDCPGCEEKTPHNSVDVDNSLGDETQGPMIIEWICSKCGMNHGEPSS
jgi:hypothetical protein